MVILKYIRKYMAKKRYDKKLREILAYIDLYG